MANELGSKPPNEKEIIKDPREMKEGEWHKLDENYPDDPPLERENDERDI